jgi:hypothetical protein
MKTITRVALIGLPALLLSQGPANAAATNARAVEACAAKIETYFEDKQTADLNLKIEQSALDRNRRLARLTVFELDAFNASDQSVVGRFSCTVNNRAKVIDLVALPLAQPDAEIRGRG